jgi:2-keto-4-pentenoate hydratase/2-oxohepta-3-ene-1,7-dioic acid hydratase in catechol pathway
LNFRLVTCINAPYGDMWLPSKSEQFDYELEFTAVIGRRCRGMTRAQVPLVVVGYTIFNDGSVRDYQRQVHNNLGKLGYAWPARSLDRHRRRDRRPPQPGVAHDRQW